MTIGTNQFQVSEIIVFPVPVFVMHLQYFVNVIAASFTGLSSQIQKPNLDAFIMHYLIPRPS